MFIGFGCQNFTVAFRRDNVSASVFATTANIFNFDPAQSPSALTLIKFMTTAFINVNLFFNRDFRDFV